MFEGCNIHLSPIDGKRLCSFSQKICKQHRLNGFAFCIRHILEDTNAPFKQCQYTMKSNGEKCFNPVKVSSEQIYCNSHLQVLGLLPKTIPKKIIKKSHDTIPMSSTKNSNVKNAKNQLMKKLKNQKLQKKRRNQLLMLNRKIKTSTAAKVNERKTTTEENEDNGNNKFWYDTVAETLKKTEKNIEKWRSKKLDEPVECYREMKMKYKKEMDDVHVVRSDVQECNKELDITNSYQSSLLITPERTYHNDLHVDNIATQERKALNKFRHQYSQLKESISSKKSHLSYSVLSKLIESVKKDPLETANVINVSNNPHTATILKDQKEICGYSIPCCIVNKKSRCSNSVVPYTKYCKKHILNDEEQLIYFKPAAPYVKPSTYINGVTYTFLCNDAQKQNTKKKVEANGNKTKKHSRTSSSNKKSRRNKSDISDQSSLNESSDFNDRTNSDESSASSATEEDETPEEAFHLPAGSIRSYSPVNVADEDSLSTFQNRKVDFEDDDVELIRCGGSKPFSFEANNAMSRDLSSPTLNQLSSSNFNSFNSSMFLSSTKGLSTQSIVSPMTASFFSSFNNSSTTGGTQSKVTTKVHQQSVSAIETSGRTLKISPLNKRTENDFNKVLINQGECTTSETVRSNETTCESTPLKSKQHVNDCASKISAEESDRASETLFTREEATDSNDSIPLEKVNPDIFFSSAFPLVTKDNI